MNPVELKRTFKNILEKALNKHNIDFDFNNYHPEIKLTCNSVADMLVRDICNDENKRYYGNIFDWTTSHRIEYIYTEEDDDDQCNLELYPSGKFELQFIIPVRKKRN